MDAPPGTSCPFIQTVISTITGVNIVIVVTEPSLSGLHDLERTLEISDKFRLRTWVVINKYDIRLFTGLSRLMRKKMI
jgi:MinD superfamily P-loop ATPase